MNPHDADTVPQQPTTVGAALMHIWHTRDIHAEDLVPDSNGLLRRADPGLEQATLGAWSELASPDPAASPAAASDPSQTSGMPDDPSATLPAPAGDTTAGVELGIILGEGGMGVVRAGVQLALRRTVAVKELRPAASNPKSIAALLREAWVSGNLEHPNIVPVHALVPGVGSPRIIMKRVEGTAWSELLEQRRAPEDDLDHHLGVLGHVCRAVHFAHSRGVLHLDLKPANVMLGRYGEVYLVDWGIAAGLGDDGPPWLPKASAIARVCGTPSSMAPELAAGDGSRIDGRTDVYGLGTMLHEVLTNLPRHDGATIQDVLVHAFHSTPVTYPTSVPRELAAIANRATARDPSARFADAEALRQAIEAFIAHRGAARLVDDALMRLERVEALVRHDAGQARTNADSATLERLFVECRFALELALSSWPDSVDARDGKRRLMELMIDDCVASRQWQRAVALLGDLEAPSPELVQRVDALALELAAREAEREALERLGHETDVNFNRLSRSAFAAICGGLWIAWNLTAAWLAKGPLAPLGYDVLIGSVVLTLVMYAMSLWLFRRTLLSTAVNRNILALFGAWFVMVLLGFVGAWQAGEPPMLSITHTYTYYLGFCLSVAVFVDRRAILSSLVVVPFTIIGPAHPDIAFELVAAIGGLVGFSFAWIWRRPANTPLYARRAS